MSSPGTSRRIKGRRWLLAVVGALAALSTRCDYDSYPVSASFCDDWCQTFQRKDCDQEPENCVRGCERSVADPPCFTLQESLLDCYRAASPDDFVCTGSSFRAEARPKESTCRDPRDALIQCAYPDVKLCLDLCRAVESSQADAAVAGGAFDATSSGQVPHQCPAEDIPCDSICWIAGRYLSSPTDGGGAAGATADASFSGSSPFGQSASRLIACALDKAESCRRGELASPDAGSSDQTWGTVLASCADEQNLFE